ncbi:Gfo/Idh/MocA family oxidoreductase [Micromonospora sp. M12]
MVAAGPPGGPVVEQAAHVLDLIRVLAGEVTEVTAYGNGTPPPVDGADIDSVTTAALRFANGAVGTLSAACVLAGSTAPAWRSSPTGWPSRSPRTGCRSATPTVNGASPPTRKPPGWRWTAPSSTPSAASATTCAPRTPRRWPPNGWPSRWPTRPAPGDRAARHRDRAGGAAHGVTVDA